MAIKYTKGLEFPNPKARKGAVRFFESKFTKLEDEGVLRYVIAYEVRAKRGETEAHYYTHGKGENKIVVIAKQHLLKSQLMFTNLILNS